MYFSLKMLLDSRANAPLIRVRACKLDNSVHRSWDVQLIEETVDLWTFIGVFAEEISHPLLGVIRPGTISLEFYWKNRCYNVFRFHEPEGELRNFYCNVNLPPVLESGVLSYVDLDIDVLVAPDLSYQVLDMEEFKENAVKHSYSTQIIKKAQNSLAEIIKLVESKKFPFDYTAEKL